MKFIFAIAYILVFGLSQMHATVVDERKVNCNFDKGSLCSYKSTDGNLYKKFNVVSGNRKNQVPGIPSQGPGQGYIAARLTPTKKSKFNSKARLWLWAFFKNKRVVKFRHFETIDGLKLNVCCGNFQSSCRSQTHVNTKPWKNRWRYVQVHCPKGKHLLQFECVNHGKREGACGIDNIQLQQRHKNKKSQYSHNLKMGKKTEWGPWSRCVSGHQTRRSVCLNSIRCNAHVKKEGRMC